MSGTGNCLCGDTKLNYSADPLFFLLCHCTDCQKATGSPIASGGKSSQIGRAHV